MIRNQTSLWQWIMAVIVSIALWVFSMAENHFEINCNLPLSPHSISPNFIVLNEISYDSIKVTFTGRGSGVLHDQLKRHPEAIQVNITLSDQNQDFPLRITRELSGNNIVFREGRYSSLEATAFSPGNIELIIDRNIIRNLPVKLVSTEAIPERYYWQITSNSRVEVSGAESIVSRLDNCHTIPVAPNTEDEHVTIVKPDGVVYIIPSSVSAELVPPVPVITEFE